MLGSARASRDGETGAHLSIPLADHADVAPKALRRFLGAHLEAGESPSIQFETIVKAVAR